MQYHIINSKYVHVKQFRLTHEVKIQKKNTLQLDIRQKYRLIQEAHYIEKHE